MLSLVRYAKSAVHRQLTVFIAAGPLPRSLRTGPVLRYDQELDSVSLFAKSKKYFLDVKQNEKGSYLKLSELSKGYLGLPTQNGILKCPPPPSPRPGVGDFSRRHLGEKKILSGRKRGELLKEKGRKRRLKEK
jgi:hypothetical protein